MANKKVKVVLITGSMVTRNGLRESTLSSDIEKQLQALYDDSGVSNVDVKTEVKWDTAASGGSALLIVTYEGKITPPKTAEELKNETDKEHAKEAKEHHRSR